MSDFKLAIPVVLRREGGFVDNLSDPGGATNFGVSLRWLKAQGLLTTLQAEEGAVTQSEVRAVRDMAVTQSEVRAVRDMTEAQAEAFYNLYWWEKYGYGKIISQPIATKVFDTAVNLGPSPAHKIAQEAAIALGASLGVPDGQLGPKSIEAINSLPSVPLLAGMQDLQAAFYKQLVLKNGAEKQFLAGWLNRAYDRV